MPARCPDTDSLRPRSPRRPAPCSELFKSIERHETNLGIN